MIYLQPCETGGFCNSKLVSIKHIYSHVLDFQDKYIQNLT